MVNKQQSLLNAGKSITERLWEELDRIMDILMVEGEPSKWDDSTGREVGDVADWKQWGEHRGNAQGVAYAIAMMYSPYAPNVPHIKELAMQRWEERNAS
jgi:hypothetical protein